MLAHTAPHADVDGTLIHSVGDQSNKIHKTAFAAAFRDVFDIDTHIDIVPHHGSTDPLILIKVLEVSGVPSDKARAQLPALKQAMLAHFEANRGNAGNGLQLLPGVLQLMQTLKVFKMEYQNHACVHTRTQTGNGWRCHLPRHGQLGGHWVGQNAGTGLVRSVYWCVVRKVLHVQSIIVHVTAPAFGGFGSDHCSGNTEESWRDRAELVRIAAHKASAAGYDVTAHYHVGDTPQDILAAEEGGAIAVGVLTGVFDKESLMRVSNKPSTVVLEGLHCLKEFLATVGLS